MTTERRMVTLTVDIVVDVPEGLDPDSKEGQDLLRAEFVDYLESAEHIQLSFEIGDKED